MIKTKAAIPTNGPRGIRFRSRLEAQWAYFFDFVGWNWEYEPFDLRGYIPDFILKFAKVEILVEIKGTLDKADLNNYVKKIEDSGWVGDYMICGACIWKGDWPGESGVLGLLGYFGGHDDPYQDNLFTSSPLLVSKSSCECCEYYIRGIQNFNITGRSDWSPYNVSCNSGDGMNGWDYHDGILTYTEVNQVFVQAKNKAQWKGK